MLSRRHFLTTTAPALLLAGCMLTLNACKHDTTVPPEPTGGQAGYLTGKVTDPQGKALPQATIYVDHTVFTGEGPEVKTSTDGSYKVQLAKVNGQWVAKGYILKRYNDRTYKILLDPENPDSFTAEEKPVRNFQWKLTGHIPDLSLDMYYGGTLETFRDPNSRDLWDNENVEFTLTPVGPLIDGSTGQVVKLQAKKRYSNIFKDVPMGRYKITAVYKPTGESLLVCDAWDMSFNYQPSVTLDFLGVESVPRNNQMGVGFTNRR